MTIASVGVSALRADRSAIRAAFFLGVITMGGPAAAGTAELAVGISNAIVLGPPSDDILHLGVAPLIAAVGWWVSPGVALGVRSVTYLLPSTVAGRREPFLAVLAGPAVSLTPRRDILLGVAAGPGLITPAPVGSSPYLHANRGLGLSLRASWAVRPAGASEILVGTEVLPVFFDDGDLLVGALLTVGLWWR